MSGANLKHPNWDWTLSSPPITSRDAGTGRVPLTGNAVVGESPAVRTALEQLHRVAATDSTVLLLGETGTGKELFANEIHEMSARRGRPMVRVNCAAMPATLIESELFGREKGAYTGALARQVGRFELANHSTIFLDEVGDLPADVQVKLLRVLEERQIERLAARPRFPWTCGSSRRRTAISTGESRPDLPSGSVLSAQRVSHRGAAAASTGRGHSAPGVAVRRGVREGVRQADRRDFTREHGGPAAVPVARQHPRAAQRRRARDDPDGRSRADDSRSAGLRWRQPFRYQAGRRPEGSHSERARGTGWRIRGTAGAADLLGLKPTTLETRMAKLGLSRRKAF